jgi:hypothetical protein
LFYEVNDEAARWFDQLVADSSSLANSQKVWRTVQSGRVVTTHQHKTNAGATNVVRRVPVAVTDR